jgi:hypothetical protein
MFEAYQTPPLLEPHETEIVDSGCTDHFLLVNAPCLNKVKSQTPLTVRLPNGATMESSHTTELNIPHLNAAASIAHVFHGMANHSLLSVGHFCNEGYVVTFKDASVTVCDSQKFQIMSGPRDSDTASERIVDTLEFFPHNYQMPRLSSTDRLIMAANDMTDSLQNPHLDVPFTQVGDDTISALTALAEIFKLKLQNV